MKTRLSYNELITLLAADLIGTTIEVLTEHKCVHDDTELSAESINERAHLLADIARQDLCDKIEIACNRAKRALSHLTH